ncbi:MAG: hypothetical protein K1X92_00530 [Bacteroidia bacterium]|nr:hypothetical protein [Bacteroidia bacterium]
MIKKWYNQLLKINPRTLLLIDGLGALVTTFSLSVVLQSLPEYFLIPHDVLSILYLISGAFCIYSLSCYFLVKQNTKPYLKIIALANASYCLLTLSIVLLLFSKLSIFDILYFLIEVIIVLPLILVEVRASR